MPISDIACTASGFKPFGSMPALSGSKVPPRRGWIVRHPNRRDLIPVSGGKDPFTGFMAQKKIEAALPTSAERNRFQDEANFRSALASRGGLLNWMKQQLKPGFPARAQTAAVKN